MQTLHTLTQVCDNLSQSMVKPALYRCGSNDCEISALVLFIRGRSSSQRFEQIKWLRSEEHNAKVYKIFVNKTIIVKKYFRGILKISK